MKKFSMILIALLCAALMVCAAGGETRQGEEFIGEWETTYINVNGTILSKEDFVALDNDFNLSIRMEDDGSMGLQLSSSYIDSVNFSGNWIVDDQGTLYVNGQAFPNLSFDEESGSLLFFDNNGNVMILEKKPSATATPKPTQKPTPKPTATPAPALDSPYIGNWVLTGININGMEIDADTFAQLGGVDLDVSFSFDEQGNATIQMSSAAMPEFNGTQTGTWTVDSQGTLYLDGTALPFITIDPSTGNMLWDMSSYGMDAAIVLENRQPAEPSAKATIKEVSFTGSALVGKVSKPSPGLTVSVTFYIEGNYYMGTVGQVEDDGTFEVEGVGPIRYITVILTSPGGEKLSANEIFVQ